MLEHVSESLPLTLHDTRSVPRQMSMGALAIRHTLRPRLSIMLLVGSYEAPQQDSLQASMWIHEADGGQNSEKKAAKVRH